MRWVGCLRALLFLAVAACLAINVAHAARIGESTEHFSIRYDDIKVLSPGTGRVLEDSYRAIDGYFGNLPETIKVVVISDKKMDEVGKHVEAFSAWNSKSSSIAIREDTLQNKKSLAVVVKHEICHLSLNEILSKKSHDDYAWLEEGVCMVLSSEPLDDVKVAKYIDSRGFMTTDEIAKAIDSKDYGTCKNAYLQSFSLCKYISEKYSKSALVDIVKSRDESFDSAFKRRTGIEFASCYEDWKSVVTRSAKSDSSQHFSSYQGMITLDDLEV